jgi:hypothetical protein
MTQHELSQLVRDHVASDEPPFRDPDDVIAHGRRRVRGRRMATGGVAALVAAVAMGGALMAVSGDEPGDTTTIDPAIQEALDDYDPWAMPELLDQEAREVFSRSVDDLGPSEFEATDSQAVSIPSEHYDKASGMSVSYGGDSDHELRVSLSHSRSEAEGDAQRYCADGLAEGVYLQCTVERHGEDTAISMLWALRPYQDLQDGTMMVTRKDQLDSIDPDRLWFEHSVKVIKSETFVTYTSERVHASTREAAEGLFQVPVADLVELGLDPTLVIPHPPAGENNCPAWALHGENISCGVTPPDPDLEPAKDR